MLTCSTENMTSICFCQRFSFRFSSSSFLPKDADAFLVVGKPASLIQSKTHNDHKKKNGQGRAGVSMTSIRRIKIQSFHGSHCPLCLRRYDKLEGGSKSPNFVQGANGDVTLLSLKTAWLSWGIFMNSSYKFLSLIQNKRPLSRTDQHLICLRHITR